MIYLGNKLATIHDTLCSMHRFRKMQLSISLYYVFVIYIAFIMSNFLLKSVVYFVVK